MPFQPSSLKYPELVFGIAGPIGIDIDAIIRVLRDTLNAVAYKTATIKITDEISDYESGESKPVVSSFYNMMRFKMAHASALRQQKNDPAYLMRVAIAAIRRERQALCDLTDTLTNEDDVEESVVAENIDIDKVPFHEIARGKKIAFRSAYIVRQIKRPEEVSLMRFVYGKQFILLSGYGTEIDRLRILQDKIKSNEAGDMQPSREKYLAGQLIELDASEEGNQFGQSLREAFHRADVVVDGISKTKMRSDIERFINALFGLNEIAPTKAEYGMFSAHSASLRSSDLSRQVGAAIYSKDGEILSQGCNEVPKAFGGTYWDTESPDYRDIKLGRDSNDVLKVDVLKDLIQIMKKNGVLSDKIIKAGSPLQIVNFLLDREKGPSEFDEMRGSLKNAKILDLTEYGRVVHAEMNSICDAARKGTPLANAILYTTTFPCHNCTKHIIAAGIREVVFLEPYPKSKAKELHDNEVEIEQFSDSKVVFRFFSGITPELYQDIFTKSKRKKDGIAVRWQHGGPAPMVSVTHPTYIELEKLMSEEPNSDAEEESED